MMVRIQERRKSLGISQTTLARHAGISRTALSLIENGRLHPSARTVQAIERGLDPFTHPVLLVHGGRALGAATLLREMSRELGLPYAITLDVAAWILTGYQTPAVAWAYVRPLEAWVPALRRRGVRRPRAWERADLIILRAPPEALRDTRVVEGFTIVHPRRLLEDCARLGGRRALDAAKIFLEFPEVRTPGLRLDADALLKAFEETFAPLPSRRSTA